MIPMNKKGIESSALPLTKPSFLPVGILVLRGGTWKHPQQKDRMAYVKTPEPQSRAPAYAEALQQSLFIYMV